MPIQECMHRCHTTNAQSPKPINITMAVKAFTANLPEWQWLTGCYTSISWICKDRHTLRPLKLNTRPEHTEALTCQCMVGSRQGICVEYSHWKHLRHPSAFYFAFTYGSKRLQRIPTLKLALRDLSIKFATKSFLNCVITLSVLRMWIKV